MTAADERPIWGERVVLDGTVDFTIMYAAHDAFSRDLRLLAAACATGRAWEPATLARWQTFERQLRIHHQVEDEALWPPLREALRDDADAAVLDAMEAEHAEIDPRLESIAAAFPARDLAALRAAIRSATVLLTNHLRHEENQALALVEKHLGPAGWGEFGRHARRVMGLRGGAVFFPWMLEDAPAPMARSVLSLLPPPARVLCRRVWIPRYEKKHR